MVSVDVIVALQWQAAPDFLQYRPGGDQTFSGRSGRLRGMRTRPFELSPEGKNGAGERKIPAHDIGPCALISGGYGHVMLS
tara:strand:- start:78 stop:320 length:243 start_codon:yes stop_codon:yes gene_type:complete